MTLRIISNEDVKRRIDRQAEDATREYRRVMANRIQVEWRIAKNTRKRRAREGAVGASKSAAGITYIHR